MRALILVDIQNDFLPNGALAVPRGDEVIAIAGRVQPRFDPVIAKQDWHPANHGRFASRHPGRSPARSRSGRARRTCGRPPGATELSPLGLATDDCVRFTALDARQLGFRTFLVEDGSGGVELRPGDVARAVQEMQAAGVRVVHSGDLG